MRTTCGKITIQETVIKMLKHDENTSMGGTEGRFQSTCLTELLNARTLDETRRNEAVNELIKKYWKPVYCYLRRRGCANEAAKDLTQGFFHEVVLGRDLIQKADKTQGKFRSFLLTALDRYAVDVYHKENAGKRSPKSSIVTLDTNDVDNLLKTQSKSDPEQLFHYAWASEVLEQVLAKIREDCFKADRGTYWKVFYAKVVAPIVGSAETPKLSELCKKYEIKNETKASNMISYVKERFRKVMKRHLRQFVQSDMEVEEEFNEILRILSEKSTR